MSAPRGLWTGGASNATAPGGRPPRGAITTIADGLSLALAFPFLLAIPVLVDLWLWLGIQISPGALTARAASIAESLDRAGAGRDLTTFGVLFVPSLLDGLDRQSLYHAWRGAVLHPGSWWLVCLIILGLVVLGLALSAVFRVPLAYVVREQRLTPGAVARSIVRAWLRMLALIALLVGVALIITVPVLFGSVLFLVIGVNLLPLLVFPGLVAAVYLFFVLDAIIVSEVGPVRAVVLSVTVVRRNFWPVVGLIASTLVISLGLPAIWLKLTGTLPGLLIGILANAFVGTGLILASMQFYYDRLRRLTPPVGQPAAPRPPAH